jgi:hypothetical protein
VTLIIRRGTYAHRVVGHLLGVEEVNNCFASAFSILEQISTRKGNFLVAFFLTTVVYDGDGRSHSLLDGGVDL